MRQTDRHTFFFTKADVFSNWHPSWFTVRGIRFNCVEGGMEADAPPSMEWVVSRRAEGRPLRLSPQLFQGSMIAFQG